MKMLGTLCLLPLLSAHAAKPNTIPEPPPAPTPCHYAHPCPDWQISVDVLYWRAKENRLQYANQPSDIGDTFDFTKRPLIGPHFEWNTGFREKFAYEPRERNWDLYVQWYQIKNKATGNVEAPGNSVTPGDGSGFYPVWHLDPNALPSDFALTGEETWKLSTNVVDAVWGHHFDWARWFRLTARAGARGAFLDQHIAIVYTGGVFPNGEESTTMRNNYRGAGPMVQLDPEFYLTKNHNLSIYCSGAAAMLLGTMFLKSGAMTYFTFAHPGIHTSHFKLRWAVDALAGIRWRIPFSKKHYAFTLKGGGEFHEFFSQFRLPSPTLNLLKGDRNLQLFGWFASIQFEF